MKTIESGGPCGFDAGKKVKGCKRHILTDTDGNMLGVTTHTAGIQDKDGAPDVITGATESFASLAHPFADGGCGGKKLEAVLQALDGPTIEIVGRPEGAESFVVIAQQRVVERTFAWLSRCHRFARDWEATITSSEACRLHPAHHQAHCKGMKTVSTNVESGSNPILGHRLDLQPKPIDGRSMVCLP